MTQFIPWLRSSRYLVLGSLVWGILATAATPQTPPLPPGDSTAGGSRGDLCLVAPTAISPEIWHLNPVFLWQGGLIEALEVHDVATGDSLWRVDLFNFLPRLRYNGPGLESGREYTWTLYDELTGDAVMKADFQVMESAERERIATELEQLSQDLRASGAEPLDIGLARITYFAEQELWADALTEVYLTRPAAPALSHYVREVTERICGE